MAPIAVGLRLLNLLSFVGSSAVAFVSLAVLLNTTAANRGTSLLFGFIAGAAGGLALAAIWQFSNQRRLDVLARRYPDAVAVPAVKSPELVQVGTLLGFRGGTVPAGLTLLVTDQALEIWSGTFSYSKGAAVDLGLVSAVHASEGVARGRRSRGMVFALRETDVSLIFIVTGGGFGGLFPQSRAALERLTERVRIRISEID